MRPLSPLKSRFISALALLFVVLSVVPVLTACRGRTVLTSKGSKQSDKQVVGAVVGHKAAESAGPAPEVVGKNDAKIWFTQAEGDKVIFVSDVRECPAQFENTNQALTFALNELLAGTNGVQGLSTEIPAGTTLLKIDDDKASGGININLSHNFIQGGGTDSFEARLEQLRRTVDGIVGARPVYLNIEGQRLTASSDGLEVKQPINSAAP